MKNAWLVLLLVLLLVLVGYLLYRAASGPAATDLLVVLPGMTGDLAKRKVLPALYALHRKGLRFRVLGTSRTKLNLAELLESARRFASAEGKEWQEFCRSVSCCTCDLSDARELAARAGRWKRRLVYMALPPYLFLPTTEAFVRAGLLVAGEEHRVIFEKPFGSDLESSRQLNAALLQLLPEKQLYRADHYAAKCALRRLTGLRESLGPIRSVRVDFHEKLGIEGRGDYYDRYGAVRDVFQNHMLQLLASFAVGTEAEKKAAFLNSLRVTAVCTAQYPGYKDELGVKPGSTTETYVWAELCADRPEWRGVRFVLEAGKRMPEKRTEIRVQAQDSLVVRLTPREEVEFRGTVESISCSDPYERLLVDAIGGKRQYAISFPEIEAQWRLADPVRARG